MTTPQWITDAAREMARNHEGLQDKYGVPTVDGLAAIIASHYTAAQGWRPIEQPKEDERAKQD